MQRLTRTSYPTQQSSQMDGTHAYARPCHAMQAVKGLMQKLLLQLIAELQRLGAVVVHADGGSLILSTGKRNLTAAVG